MKKMSTQQLSRTNSIIGIFVGLAELGFMAYQAIDLAKQIKEAKKQATEEAKK